MLIIFYMKKVGVSEMQKHPEKIHFSKYRVRVKGEFSLLIVGTNAASPEGTPPRWIGDNIHHLPANSNPKGPASGTQTPTVFIQYSGIH